MPLSFEWPFPERPSRSYKALSAVTLGLVGTLGKLWMSKSRIHIGKGLIFIFLEYFTSVRIENGKNND